MQIKVRSRTARNVDEKNWEASCSTQVGLCFPVGGGFYDQRVTGSTATKCSRPLWWHSAQNTANSAQRVRSAFCARGKCQCRKRKEVRGRRSYFILVWYCRRPGKTNKFQQCNWCICCVVCQSAGGDYWLLPVKLLHVPERPGCAQLLHSQLYIRSINYSHW